MKTILFDYDDTLAETETIALGIACQNMNTLLANRGIQKEYTDSEYRRKFTGLNFRGALKVIHEETGLSLTPEEVNTAVEHQNTTATLALGEGARPTPGANELLAELYCRGAQMAIVSSSARKRIWACLKRCGQDRYFTDERIFSAQEGEVPRSKPDPYVYLNALRSLSISAENAVAIEDSLPGVRSAVAAGIETWGYLNGEPGNEETTERAQELQAAGVKEVFSSFDEIAKKLLIR